MCVFMSDYVKSLFNVIQCYFIQRVYSVEFKFGMYITGHHRTNPIDFRKYRTHTFFLQKFKKEFLYITAYGVKFFKVF